MRKIRKARKTRKNRDLSKDIIHPDQRKEQMLPETIIIRFLIFSISITITIWLVDFLFNYFHHLFMPELFP